LGDDPQDAKIRHKPVTAKEKEEDRIKEVMQGSLFRMSRNVVGQWHAAALGLEW